MNRLRKVPIGKPNPSVKKSTVLKRVSPASAARMKRPPA